MAVSPTAILLSKIRSTAVFGSSALALSRLTQCRSAAVLYGSFSAFSIEVLLFSPTALAAYPGVGNTSSVSIHLMPVKLSISNEL